MAVLAVQMRVDAVTLVPVEVMEVRAVVVAAAAAAAEAPAVMARAMAPWAQSAALVRPPQMARVDKVRMAAQAVLAV